MPEISPSRPRGHWWHEPTRTKACITCGERKRLDQFYAYSYTTRQGRQSTRYESRCKPCQRERADRRRKADPTTHIVQLRQWRQENAEHLRQYAKARNSRPEIKQRRSMIQCARQARMKAGSPGREDPAIIAVYVEAKAIEELASVCPVFDLPELGKKMHVDHIIPVARGGKHVADNLQILPAGINMRKWAHL